MVRVEVTTKILWMSIHNVKMKTDFQVLPFYDSLKETSLYDLAFYNYAPKVNFRVYCPYNELLPFKAPITELYCGFILLVKDYNNNKIAEISSEKIKHRIVKKGNQRFVIFEGGIVDCLDLGSCKLPYYIQIGQSFSEWFWVSDTSKMTKFELGNEQDLLTIPYSLGFKQYFWLDTKIGTSEIETFKSSSRDERGDVKTKFTKISETFNFYFFDVPAYMKQVFQSFESISNVKINGYKHEITSLKKQTVVKAKRADDNFQIYEVELSIPSDVENILGYCEEPNYLIDSDCTGVLIPQGGVCFEPNVIQNVEDNCVIEQIVPQPICTENIIDFFAEVTYQ
jgi:hypothetical protein